VSGTYRLVHGGERKQLLGGQVVTFTGITTNFTVIASSANSTGQGQGGAGDAASAAVHGGHQHTAVDPVAMLVGGVSRCTSGSSACSSMPALWHRHKWGWLRGGWHLWWQLPLERISSFALFKPLWPAKLRPTRHMSLQARWAALTSLYETNVRYKAALGSPRQHYVAWWRGEGICSSIAVKGEAVPWECVYGPNSVIRV
jgi:hypothetical protein